MVVDLGDLKPEWLAWCAGQGVKPSEATRQVISKVLQKSAPPVPGPAAEVKGSRDERRRRREVTLTESEDRLAKALNSVTDQRDAYSADVVHELRVYIEHHVGHVSALLESNAERWKLL